MCVSECVCVLCGMSVCEYVCVCCCACVCLCLEYLSSICVYIYFNGQ